MPYDDGSTKSTSEYVDVLLGIITVVMCSFTLN